MRNTLTNIAAILGLSLSITGADKIKDDQPFWEIFAIDRAGVVITHAHAAQIIPLVNLSADAIRDFLAKDQVKKEALAAITNATQADANQYYGWTAQEITSKWGLSVTNLHSGGNKPFRMLVYDWQEGAETCFVFYGSSETVGGGFFKGMAIWGVPLNGCR